MRQNPDISTADHRNTGVLLALGAYGWWGVVPAIYYHALQEVPVMELIAWRVLAGLPIMLVILGMTGRLNALRSVLARPRVLAMLAVSTLLEARAAGLPQPALCVGIGGWFDLEMRSEAARQPGTNAAASLNVCAGPT